MRRQLGFVIVLQMGRKKHSAPLLYFATLPYETFWIYAMLSLHFCLGTPLSPLMAYQKYLPFHWSISVKTFSCDPNAPHSPTFFRFSFFGHDLCSAKPLPPSCHSSASVAEQFLSAAILDLQLIQPPSDDLDRKQKIIEFENGACILEPRLEKLEI